MKVNRELYVLELPMNFGGVERILNLSLIVDPGHGLTLVDAGLPGQLDLIEAALSADGLSIDDVKNIIVTHQDMDHLGSLKAVKDRTGATVYAFVDEVPYVEGTLRSVKYPSAERIAQNPGLGEMLGKLERTKVDKAVTDGAVFEGSAGAIAVATPGHTLGHMSIYLPNTKTLISGDALTSEGGTLNGPMEMATPDMPTAMDSVKRLAELDVETIVCYHGGLVTEDASGQLRRVSSSA